MILTFFLACTSGPKGNVDIKVPAFPGAEGAGKYTSGGRGGTVYIVTNLNDDGHGSLRDGIQKKYARTIVFAVSGYIDLKSQLVINNDNITIAGQTAPGDGICLRGEGLRINANNVIVRYLRIRPGDFLKKELDALQGLRHKNIIVDHCSVSWATDEVCSFYDNENLTVQWCIISESLNQSYHLKGAHGYGGIWGGQKASFHHNLLAHHVSRNPRLQGSRKHGNPESEQMEMINNVVYNWRSKCIYAGEEGNYSIAANVFKPGPATKKSSAKVILEPYAPYITFYLGDNVLEGNPSLTEDNLSAVMMPADSVSNYFVPKRMVFSEFKPESAKQAYNNVLRYAGANLKRDAVDARIVFETKHGTSQYGQSGIINSQDEVGAWPVLLSKKAPIDTDKDGMPDEWEQANNLDKTSKSDAVLFTLHPNYTNIEVYINSLCEQYAKVK